MRFCDLQTRGPQRGFTLIELLLVVTIISILMVLSVGSFRNMVGSTELSTSAVAVVDALNMARQRALSMNVPVEVRFYRVPPKAGGTGTTAYRAVGIYQINENGTKLIHKLMYLSGNNQFSDSEPFGTLLFHTPLSTENLTLGGVKVSSDYHCFQYLPDGTTSLDLHPPASDDSWHVMVFNANHPPVDSTPPSNYVSIQLDPVSGRTETFQPGM